MNSKAMNSGDNLGRFYLIAEGKALDNLCECLCFFLQRVAKAQTGKPDPLAGAFASRYCEGCYLYTTLQGVEGDRERERLRFILLIIWKELGGYLVDRKITALQFRLLLRSASDTAANRQPLSRWFEYKPPA